MENVLEGPFFDVELFRVEDDDESAIVGRRRGWFGW